MGVPFKNRTEAGRLLAQHLQQHANKPNVVVLALPRGGVPVGYEVAKALNAPLDIFMVRKLGLPNNEELALGAVATGGVRVLNPSIVRAFSIDEKTLDRITQNELRRLERQERFFRGDRPFSEIQGREVILVDDGLATGATMKAMVGALRKHQPAKIIVAVPIGAPETCKEFESEVDEIVCAETPTPFFAVGMWYRDFTQTSDEEVRDLLHKAANAKSMHVWR
jgi:putative phosphoribosyl transferase